LIPVTDSVPSLVNIRVKIRYRQDFATGEEKTSIPQII
jgi:hypothetical protein